MSNVLDYDLDGVTEARPVPEGTYDLIITEADLKESGPNSKHPGSPLIRFTIAFKDLDLNAPNIAHYVSLPFGEDDENKAFKLLMFKRFLSLFHINFERGMSVEELLLEANGSEGRSRVTVSETDENGNYYNRLYVPKISDEPAIGRGKPPRN